MNTALLILSGVAAGFATALFPKKSRRRVRSREITPRQQAEKDLERELSPFVHFGQ